jgi:hypothetical protein
MKYCDDYVMIHQVQRPDIESRNIPHRKNAIVLVTKAKF